MCVLFWGFIFVRVGGLVVSGLSFCFVCHYLVLWDGPSLLSGGSVGGSVAGLRYVVFWVLFLRLLLVVVSLVFGCLFIREIFQQDYDLFVLILTQL